MQCNIINYGHHAVHCIPMTYLFCNWKFVHLIPFTYFAHNLYFKNSKTEWVWTDCFTPAQVSLCLTLIPYVSAWVKLETSALFPTTPFLFNPLHSVCGQYCRFCLYLHIGPLFPRPLVLPWSRSSSRFTCTSHLLLAPLQPVGLITQLHSFLLPALAVFIYHYSVPLLPAVFSALKALLSWEHPSSKLL